MGITTSLSEDFLYFWELLCPEFPLTKEFKFHPTRKWRLDYPLTSRLLAIEIEGGCYVNGRHSRPIGFINDCEKYNELILNGWKLIRITHFGKNRSETSEIIKKLILRIRKDILNS
jgi:hypothetical protein